MFLLPFQLEKAGLALLTQDLEVAVTCQLGLQSSEGLPEAGHPPPMVAQTHGYQIDVGKLVPLQ